MSTREPTDRFPFDETQIVAGQIPKPTETPTNPGFTPGVAFAAAKVPAGPTLPDWDPATLTMMMSRLSNDLFAPSVGAPTTTPVPEIESVDVSQPQSMNAPSSQVAAPLSVPSSASSSAVPPSSVPSSSMVTLPGASQEPVQASTMNAQGPIVNEVEFVSPFMAPLSFASLDDPNIFLVGTLPLVDGAQPSVENSSPYWMPSPVPNEEALPSTNTAIDALAFQIEPTTDVSLARAPGSVFDPHAIRREFPILEERVHGHRLVWLDNAATTQKPQTVIDRLSYYYKHENSNIHRAAHTLAARATDAYESARETVRKFINAPSKNEIVFVRGTTEGINLVAQSWGRRHVNEGDEVVLTWLEHHANIVPWQQLCSERGARLRVAPVNDRGEVILEEYEKLLSPKTRIVAFSQVSNALGTITPAREMIELAHRHGAKVLLDGAQAISHMRVDVQFLDCDFFVFSGHKVFAPTGIGVVFGKKQLLDEMPPWQGGGNMIQDVTFERTLYHDAPARFEAGTGNIADAVGLGAALDWLSRIGVENVGRYEHELLVYATERLATVPGLTMIGTAREKAGVLSFLLAGQKTEEVGGLLDQEGIAVRSGHHCAQPILRRFGVEATVRASLAPYNTCEDIDALVAALQRLQVGKG